jgi:hypothetical protein
MGFEEHSSHVWDIGARTDRKLSSWRRYKNVLVCKQVKPTHFSKARLFSNLILEEPIVFSNLSIPIRGSTKNREQFLLKGIQNNVPRGMRIKVRSGRSETTRYLSSRELVARWTRARSIFCVTDFHFRGAALERSISLEWLFKNIKSATFHRTNSEGDVSMSGHDNDGYGHIATCKLLLKL